MKTTIRRHHVALVGALALAVVPGCSAPAPSAQAVGAKAVAAADAAPAQPAASITVSPQDGTTKVRPDNPVTVTVSGGTLGQVTVTDDEGALIEGDLADDQASWTSSGPLSLKATYTVRASAINAAGQLTEVTSSLQTLTPTDSADYFLLPSGNGEVGVGMPVVVQFAGLVDEDKQDDIEKLVSVTTSPQVDGAWGWLDARQLIWRPAEYWAPGTKVSVTADIAGVETRPGIWTTRNASTTFSVGSAMISTVDVKAHTMTVRRGGKIIRTIPVTTGKKGFETRRGTKVIISRESSRQMDAETTGLSKSDPEYYNVKVKYAMRLTWSGEFIHSAPWSVGSQGRDNVSHGCTGLSPANAKWLFDQSKMGDVVTYVGASRGLEPYNGYTMWNISLAEWAKQSALV